MWRTGSDRVQSSHMSLFFYFVNISARDMRVMNNYWKIETIGVTKLIFIFAKMFFSFRP